MIGEPQAHQEARGPGMSWAQYKGAALSSGVWRGAGSELERSGAAGRVGAGGGKGCVLDTCGGQTLSRSGVAFAACCSSEVCPLPAPVPLDVGFLHTRPFHRTLLVGCEGGSLPLVSGNET